MDGAERAWLEEEAIGRAVEVDRGGETVEKRRRRMMMIVVMIQKERRERMGTTAVRRMRMRTT
jgi:hypothetical protein